MTGKRLPSNRETTMSDAKPNRAKPTTEVAKPRSEREDRMDDEEKILEGRFDVNYPAVLTKDVPGG